MKYKSTLSPARLIATTLFLFSNLAFADQNLKFSEACSSDENLEIVAVGDILLHSPLQIQATKNPQRFKSLWSPVIPFLKKADIAYANLEGPAAMGISAGGANKGDVGLVFDNHVYTSYPQFNYHPALLTDIKDSGFDIVSTANNHSLDRRAIGIDKTIESIEKNGLKFSGTRKQVETSNSDFQWHTITESKGFKVAWLACTFSTNGIPDKQGQVLPCFQNTERLLSIVTNLANNPDINAVIVTPHWGEEYQLKQNSEQSSLGRKLIEAGATAVLATHPHVVQPWEKFISKDGREGLIVYSTGNFVSGQPSDPRQTSVLIQLNLTGAKNSKLKIRSANYLPLYMKRTSGYIVTPILDTTTAPALSQKIWNNAFGDRNRITSLNHSSSAKSCEKQ